MSGWKKNKKSLILLKMVKYFRFQNDYKFGKITPLLS